MGVNYMGVSTKVNVAMSYNGVGVRMRVARITSGKTVREIAEEVGIDDSTVYKYENGRIDFPSPSKQFAIADATGVSSYWLLSGVGKPTDDDARNEAIKFCLDSIQTTTPPLSKRRIYG